MTNDGDFVDEVRAIQASMIEPGGADLSQPEVDNLRCLIRLTVEFSHHLQEQLDPDEMRYLCESIFSGIDSFYAIGGTVRAMIGYTARSIPWDEIFGPTLRQEFNTRYCRFLAEPSFEERCRLLLDLFRLQIVFAGMFYD